MKFAVCDDEALALEEIITCLEDYAIERKVNIEYETFADYRSLENRIAEFDVFIMDYKTPVIDGLTFAKTIREKFGAEKTIIFITAYDDIVYDAFTVKTHRYILKPLDKTKLFEALDSYIKEKEQSRSLIFKNDGVSDIINASDILYIEVNDKECRVCLDNEQIISRRPISYFEELLNDAGFFRVHRAYLVNLRKIKSYEKSKVELINGEKISMSVRKYQAFCKEYIKLK